MNERDKTLLQDMLDCCFKAQKFIDGRDRADLDTDDMLSFALVRAIEVIGEAANHVSAETRQSLPKIDWKNIIGMRNILIHDYTAVDHDIVWASATTRVPELITELVKILL